MREQRTVGSNPTPSARYPSTPFQRVPRRGRYSCSCQADLPAQIASIRFAARSQQPTIGGGILGVPGWRDGGIRAADRSRRCGRLKPRERPYKVADARRPAPAGDARGRPAVAVQIPLRRQGEAARARRLSGHRHPATRATRVTRRRRCCAPAAIPARCARPAARWRELAAVQSFEAIAREWHARQLPTWTERHAADVLGKPASARVPGAWRLARQRRSRPRWSSPCCARSRRRPAVETAHRVRQRMSAVFVYAIASGVGQADPAAVVKGALSPDRQRPGSPPLSSWTPLRAMLRKAEAEPAHPATKAGLRLLALTAGAAWRAARRPLG